LNLTRDVYQNRLSHDIDALPSTVFGNLSEELSVKGAGKDAPKAAYVLGKVRLDPDAPRDVLGLTQELDSRSYISTYTSLHNSHHVWRTCRKFLD